MTASVEDRIVAMKFDNALFEQKLSQTIQSLDKLRASLDLASSTRGMQELAAASKSFSMESMAASVDGMSAKFLALATVGITALSNLTTRAIEAGATFVKSLSLGPITQGFGEFELKMGSIQTIMAGSGASLEEVNQKLADLNAYSDRTIYSFADMTSNIGKFTNAGVSLDQSVGAIQGVANVAALAGANSEEASRAMYNFAQALSTGSVKLIDWKSIELANMGTVEFKQQIIDTAVAMGTLNKSADGTLTTLKGTEVNTKNFASTLNEAWFTSEVLTSTLGKFSDTTTDIGQRASEAATRIKTFSQMISTMKESVGSGWATTFENIFGNFEQGTELWTGINDAFSKVVGSSADARNLMLKTWNDFGSRTVFFESLGDILAYIGDIIKPIKDAFRDIFPKKTGEDLIRLTQQFSLWTDKLKIGGDTAKAIRTAFSGFFAILDIGWEIIKGVAKVFFSLVGGVWSLISPILKLAAGTGGVVTGFHDMLVGGGGISAFFEGITTSIDVMFSALKSLGSALIDLVKPLAPLFGAAFDAIKSFGSGVVNFFSGLGSVVLLPIKALQALTEAIGNFFSSLSFGRKDDNDVKKTSEELEESASLASRILDSLMNVFRQIGDAFDGIIGGIVDAFKGLGGAIAGALGSGNFDQVFNILKTGLLGGILFYIRKFFTQGLKLDFGQGAVFDKIKTMLDTVTSGLKSLQANVRADTLLKIAGAMGILAIAIIALSLVDAAALAKSMAAIAAGFTQLTAVMIILEKSSMGGGSIKIIAMATGMIALATAMALLVIPIKMLSTMDMGALAKGLVGVGAGMLIMATAMNIIGNAKNLAGIVRAGIAMIAISVAMIVLARAIKSFAEMNLTEMAFGLIQAGIGIGILIASLRLMPDDIAKKGIGLLILAFSLKSLARVVQMFAGIAFGTLAKGFISISLGLAAIGLAMQTMPDDMIQKSAALILVSGAMYILGKAVEQVGGLSFGTIIKGVGGLSVMLGVLAIAILAMDQAKSGVAGLVLAAGGLLVIGHAIEQVGKIPFGELLKGLAGLAAVVAVLAVASVAAPALLTLGVAFLAIGAGLALVGVGVAAAGKGIELLAKFGGEGMKHLVAALQEFIRQLPQFVSAFVAGLVQAFIEIGNQAPELVGVIKKMLIALLDAVKDVVPKIARTLGTIISEFLKLVRQKVPEFVKTGFTMLLAFLDGIRKNVGEIVNVVTEIITGFLDALADNSSEMVSSIFNFFREVLTSVAFELGKSTTLFIDVGIALIDGLITGVTQTLGNLLNFFIELPGKIIGIITDALGITSPSTVFLQIGVDILTGLLNGLVEFVPKVLNFFIELPGKILRAVGSLITTLLPKGVELLTGFLKGIVDKAGEVISWFGGVASKVLGAIGDLTRTLVGKGLDLLGGLLNGIISGATSIWNWFATLPGQVVTWIGDAGRILWDVGVAIIQGLWEGIKSAKDWLFDKLGQVAGWIPDPIKIVLGVESPSKVFMRIGENLIQGLVIGMTGMKPDIIAASTSVANAVTDGFGSPSVIDGLKKAMMSIPSTLSNMDEFNPTITPVLDLSNVRDASRNIDGLMGVSSITPAISIQQARTIATSEEVAKAQDETPVHSGPTEVTFEQNIYAPTALSTNDIYRNTKSQIALAKEELNIA